jgi:hypothetical protein
MKERHVGIFKEGDQYHAGDETARMGEKGHTPLLRSHQHRVEHLKYKPETQNPQCRQAHQPRQQAEWDKNQDPACG